MHDHLIIAVESSIVFSMMSIFLVSFHTQFIIDRLPYTIVSAMIGMYFIDAWTTWELWFMLSYGIISGLIAAKTNKKRITTRPNNVELFVITIVQPLYLTILFPIIIPQTNVAVGVLLAFMLWSFVTLFFSIFYSENQHTLDRHLIVTALLTFITTLFFHHWKWVPPSITIGLQLFYFLTIINQ